MKAGRTSVKVTIQASVLRTNVKVVTVRWTTIKFLDHCRKCGADFREPGALMEYGLAPWSWGAYVNEQGEIENDGEGQSLDDTCIAEGYVCRACGLNVSGG